jgi:3-isopropylmalate/(R)-2-methylmalate dehydratase large subunit
MMAEQYALPGQVVVGTDSHTPHSGSLGCLAFGGGATDIANSWVTGLIRCKMPEVLRVELAGKLRPGVLARDIVQYLLQTELVHKGNAIGAVFEYTGPVVKAMPMDERATLTNMVAEMGGFTGIIEPDETTVAFLRERRGIDFQIEDWMHSDPGAPYKHTIRIDCDRLSPMVARPGDPGDSLPLAEIKEQIRIDIALGGSCTGAKRRDFDFYHEVLKWGLDRGMRVAKGTQLVLQFGTLGVRDYCISKGYLETFKVVGAEVVSPGCGACANCGPGQSTNEDQVTISSINRNFPGRSGPGKVWLGSPYTVAASALAGYITSFQALRDKS